MTIFNTSSTTTASPKDNSMTVFATRIRTAAAALTIAAAALAASPALAATGTQTMAVSATLANNCTFGTAPSMSLSPTQGTNIAGSVTTTNIQATASFSITCLAGGSGVTLGATTNANYSGGYRLRRGATGDYVPYTLSFASYGGATVNGATASVASDGNLKSIPVFGQIGSGVSFPSVGQYDDSVTFTVTF